jgi:cell division protease FtsH
LPDPSHQPKQQPEQRPPGERPRSPFAKGWIFWLLILGLVLIFGHLMSDSMTEYKEVDYTTFLNHVRQGHVKQVTIKSDYWQAQRREPGPGEGYWEHGAEVKTIRYKRSYNPEGAQEAALQQAVEKYNSQPKVESGKIKKIKLYDDAASGKLWTLFLTLLPWILIFGVLYFFIFRHMRSAGGQSILSFGKSRARMVRKERTQVTFEDVAGIDEAREEVQEIVQFLKNPDKFRRLGGRLPKGVLLVGRPGTGKTLLARAIAGESDVPFFSISGSDFVEMFVGVGASRVRDLFQQAKASSPCIIFLDEIDAVGRLRGTGLGGGHDEREQTLNAILVEMDGFESDTAIIILAATNRPDVLDPALLRPGRFDRQIVIDLPDIKGREQILKVHAKKIRLKDEKDLETIARGTPTFCGADLENLINEAAILATMRDRDAVELPDLEEARDRVMWGREKRSKVIDQHEREMIAYHEAGHAIVAHLHPDHEPLHKVGIIPRGMALGATMHLPEKDSYVFGKKKAAAELCTLMAGRVSEQLFCDDIQAGAASDLKRATELARRMVCQWGMSEKLGPVVYRDAEEHLFLGREVARHQQVSAEVSQQIDKEIRSIIDQSAAKAREILTSHAESVKAVVQALLEREVLSAEEVDAIIKGQPLPDVESEQPVEPVGSAEAGDAKEKSSTDDDAPAADPATAG